MSREAISRSGGRGARPCAPTLLLALLLALPAAALEVPYLAGRVNDLADVIPPDAEVRINAELEKLEQEKGSQVAVLTIPSLEGESLEDFSLRVAETWKLGRGKFDDGALLLIARDDRKMRLEVGYGLEGAIPDLKARRVLDDVLRPRFRAGDFGGGIEEGVRVVAGLVRGEDTLPPPEAGGSGPKQLSGFAAVLLMGFLFLATVGTFSFFALITRGFASYFLACFLTPFWFLFPQAFLGPGTGGIAVIFWWVVFIAAKVFFGSNKAAQAWQKKLAANTGGGWSSRGGGGGWSSGGGGGGWSSGGGGGGFSGGGGGFGGGGSSSSW
ncbi:MAG TPA: TPM domain-containing protein [Thermoanaerobaculia bacterium]|nr:TPM domain-containing protein [Thermoanaerobaculia bacterium]